MRLKLIFLLSLLGLGCEAHSWHSHSYDDFVLCTLNHIDKKTQEIEVITIVRKAYYCESSMDSKAIYTVIDMKYLHNEIEIQRALKEATHVQN